MISCLRFEWLSEVNNLVKNDLMNFSPPFSWDTFSVSNTSIWGGHIDGLCLIGSEIILFPFLLLPIVVGLAATAPCSTSPIQLAGRLLGSGNIGGTGSKLQVESKGQFGVSYTSVCLTLYQGAGLTPPLLEFPKHKPCVIPHSTVKNRPLGSCIITLWLAFPALDYCFSLVCFMSPCLWSQILYQLYKCIMFQQT